MRSEWRRDVRATGPKQRGKGGESKICKVTSRVLCYVSARFAGIIIFTYLVKPSYSIFLNQSTMPETRASNKQAHPGRLLVPKLRRTRAEVEAERTTKAQAKVNHEEAKKQSIIRAAEFEHADRADEDFVDATPRPPFTPKPWPSLRNKKKPNSIPVAETPDVEMSDDVKMSDDVDNTSSVPCSEKSVNENDLAVESDNPPPPAKRSKAETAGKAAAKVGTKVAREVGKKTKAAEDILPDSDEEQPKEPKPKKMKPKVRDEINTMARKIEDGKRSKYGDMVKSTSTTPQAEDRSNRKPASKAPSQAQAMRGGALKREGAIADINAMDQEMEITDNR